MSSKAMFDTKYIHVNELEVTFREAIEMHQSSKAAMCISQGVNVNQMYYDGQTVLHVLANNNDVTTFRTLYESSNEFNLDIRTFPLKETPLIIVARLENDDFFQELLRLGADINLLDIHDRGPLHYATYNGNKPMVRTLIEYRCRATNFDAFGNSPLSYCTVYRPHISLSLSIFQLLDDYQDLGPIFLENVLHCNDVLRRKITKMFIIYGVDVNYKDKNTGKTCLHIVAQTNYLPLAKDLILAGADIHLPDKLNRLAIHVAEQHQNKQVFDLLHHRHSTFRKYLTRVMSRNWHTPRLANEYWFRQHKLFKTGTHRSVEGSVIYHEDDDISRRTLITHQSVMFNEDNESAASTNSSVL